MTDVLIHAGHTIATLPADTARRLARALLAAADAPDLTGVCDYHAGRLRKWRQMNDHEPADDYARRCETVRRQCPDCGR